MVKIYYMRDNHLFVPIPCDPDEAEAVIREEFHRGYTCGTLFCRSPGKEFILHAHGRERLEEFIQEARKLVTP